MLDELDDADLALLDFVDLMRAYGISVAQAVEIASERIPDLYQVAAGSSDPLH